jgi:glutamine amidotransferase
MVRCELLGLSAGQSVSFTCSLERFAAHGNAEGSNHDGWGIAAYEGDDARIVKEPAPAADSAWVQFIERHGVESDLVVAHIRHASRGRRRYANTHPFCRELGGRIHTFAHNGTLHDIGRVRRSKRRFRPVGDTDSEEAFCSLLDRLAEVWAGDAVPSLRARRELVGEFAGELRALGPANFLYSDGEVLFAHAHKRKQPDGTIAAPGLHLIAREDVYDDRNWLAAGVNVSTTPDPVTIVASVPLSKERWRPLRPGELLVISKGRVLTD